MTYFINGLVYDVHQEKFIERSFSVINEKISFMQGDTQVNLKEMYVTPGFIDSCSQIGLSEIGIRWEGNDSFEFESNLNYQVIDGIYPFDSAFKNALRYGITVSHVVPSSKNLIGAYTAAIYNSGISVEKMLLKNKIAFSFSLGNEPKSTFNQYTKMPLTRMGIAKKIRESIQQLKNNNEHLKILIRAHKSVDIELIERLMEELNEDIYILHGTELPQGRVKMEKMVIAGPTFQYIGSNELVNLSPEIYMYLYKNKTPFLICTDHPTTNCTSLLVEATLAVREGVPRHKVLNSLTIEAARFLGIEGITGSIEEGKNADFVIWDKNPLNLDAKVIATYIKGNCVYHINGGINQC